MKWRDFVRQMRSAKKMCRQFVMRGAMMAFNIWHETTVENCEARKRGVAKFKWLTNCWHFNYEGPAFRE